MRMIQVRLGISLAVAVIAVAGAVGLWSVLLHGGSVFAAPMQQGQTPVASLSVAATRVSESNGDLAITVTLDPAPTSAISVGWQVGPDSDPNTVDAQPAQVDYTVRHSGTVDSDAGTKTGVLNFAGNKSTEVLTLNIVDDDFIDASLEKVVEVRLTTPTDGAGYTLSGDTSQLQVAVTILDGVCDRQPHVCYQLIHMVPGDEECWEVTEEQLAALDGTLDVSDSEIEDGVLRKGDFRNLPNLMGLDLSDNELTELPQGGLRKLTSLKELDLSDNEVGSLSDGFFEGVMTLRSLDMSGSPGSVTETEDDEQVSYVVVTAKPEKGTLDQSVHVRVPEGAPFPVEVTLSASPAGSKLWDSGVETYGITVPAGGLVSNELDVTGASDTTVTVSVVSAEFVDPSAEPATWADRHKGIKPVPGDAVLIPIVKPTVTVTSARTVGMEGETLTLVAELNVPVDPVGGYLPVLVRFSGNNFDKGAGPKDYTVQWPIIDEDETPVTAFRVASGSRWSELSVLLADDDVVDSIREQFVVEVQSDDDDPARYMVGTPSSVELTIVEDDICDRSKGVRDALFSHFPHTAGVPEPDCKAVSYNDLARPYFEMEVTVPEGLPLKDGDFLGLSALQILEIDAPHMAELPLGVFEGLTFLGKLALRIPSVSTLDSRVIKPLVHLEFLEISNSSLTELPDGMFVGLPYLRDVRLSSASGQEFELPARLVSTDSSEEGKLAYYFHMDHGSPFGLFINYRASGPSSPPDEGGQISLDGGSASSEVFHIDADRTRLEIDWKTGDNAYGEGFRYVFPIESALPIGQDGSTDSDSDADLPSASLSATSVSLTEGTNAVFTFGLSAAMDHNMGIWYSFRPVPSTAGEPMPGRMGGGLLSIPASSTTQTLEFVTADMVSDEPGSTYSFSVSLMEPTAGAGYQINSAQSSATVTITGSTDTGSESSEESSGS